MFSKIFVFITLAAVAAANCGNVVSSCSANNVVSNKCRCVKTVLRPVPVRSIVCKPTERREVQTFVRPVVQTISYTVNPPLCSGPNVGTVGGYGYNNVFGGNYGSLLGNAYGSLIGNNYGGLVGNTYGSSLISGNTYGSTLGCGGLVGNTYRSGCNTVC